jgi:hypothetical protein
MRKWVELDVCQALSRGPWSAGQEIASIELVLSQHPILEVFFDAFRQSQNSPSFRC